MSLRISKTLELPSDFATKRAAIVAKTGGGKTYTAAVIAEAMVDAGQPFYALDPTDAWWGLRSSANGKRAGLPVIVIGGEHGDVPLDEHAGAAIADLVVAEPSFYVISLAGIETHAGEVRFATAFLDRLYRAKAKQRAPLHGFWDEADMFAPQRPGPDQTKMLGAAEAIIRRGRIRGLGTTLITQRPAVLNKNVLTQIDILVALKIIGPQDRKAIKDYLDGVADPAQRNEVLDSLASLGLGEAWVYGPGEDPPLYQRAQIRERRTFNSSATGGIDTEPATLATVDLDALRGRLAASIEKAKADDPRQLRRQLADARNELTDLRRQLDDQEPDVVEVPVLTTEAQEALQDAAAAIGQAKAQMIDAIADASSLLGGIVDQLGIRRAPAPPPTSAPRREQRPPVLAGRPAPAAEPPSTPPTGGDDGPVLKAGARKILQTLASLHPLRVTKAQVGTLTGFKITGGTFQTYWSTLKRAGYVLDEHGEVVVTDAGLDRAGTVPPAPATTEEMVAMWGQRLKRGAREMLDVLVELHPHGITKDELAERLDMTASGGTFQTYLSTLRRNGLADVDGQTAYASDALFITGAAR